MGPPVFTIHNLNISLRFTGRPVPITAKMHSTPRYTFRIIPFLRVLQCLQYTSITILRNAILSLPLPRSYHYHTRLHCHTRIVVTHDPLRRVSHLQEQQHDVAADAVVDAERFGEAQEVAPIPEARHQVGAQAPGRRRLRGYGPGHHLR